MNISSAIVIPNPDRVQGVIEALQAFAGVEVHGVSPEGKLVITIETDDDGSNAATYQRIGQIDGVASAMMIFHQTESEPESEIFVENTP